MARRFVLNAVGLASWAFAAGAGAYGQTIWYVDDYASIAAEDPNGSTASPYPQDALAVTSAFVPPTVQEDCP